MRWDAFFAKLFAVLFALRGRPGGVPLSSSSRDFFREFLHTGNTKVSAKTVKRRGILRSFRRSAACGSICPIRGLLLLLPFPRPHGRSRPRWTLSDRCDRNCGADRNRGSFRECDTSIDREFSALSIGVLLVWLRRSISSHFLFSTLRAVDRGVSPRVGCVPKQKVDGNSPSAELGKRAIYQRAWFFMLITVVIEFCFYVQVGDFWSLSVRDLCGFLALGTWEFFEG